MHDREERADLQLGRQIELRQLLLAVTHTARAVEVGVVHQVVAEIDVRVVEVALGHLLEVQGVLVDERHVIAVAEVLEIELPVGAHRIFAARDGHHLVGLPRRGARRQIAEIAREVLRVGIEVDPHQAGPQVELDFLQAVIGHLEGRRLVEQRRCHQLAVELERPGVIRALHDAAGAFACHDLRAAVRAGVDEGADLGVLAAHHDQRHAAEVEGDVAADIGNAAVVTDAVPHLEEDAVTLALVEPLGGVAPRRQRFGAVEAPTHAVVVARIEEVFRLEHVLHWVPHVSEY